MWLGLRRNARLIRTFQLVRIGGRRMHDVTQRGAPNKVKWITSHQRQGRLSPRIENGYVLGWNYLDFIDQVMRATLLRMQIDRVSDVNILKRAEESVPMPGNAYVSGFAGRRSSANVPDRPIQRQIVGPFQNRHLQLKRGNVENPQWRRDVRKQASVVSPKRLELFFPPFS